jgi:hypothetical protein
MSSKKTQYIQHLTEQLARKETEIARQKRKLITAEKGSCLNCLCCKHTQLAYGTKLFCKLKEKTVTQYNYCDKWQSLLDSNKPDSKEIHNV